MTDREEILNDYISGKRIPPNRITANDIEERAIAELASEFAMENIKKEIHFPKIIIDKNNIRIDFFRNLNRNSKFFYGESDMEVGISEDNKISYINIEIKNGISQNGLKALKKAIENGQ